MQKGHPTHVHYLLACYFCCRTGMWKQCWLQLPTMELSMWNWFQRSSAHHRHHSSPLPPTHWESCLGFHCPSVTQLMTCPQHKMTALNDTPGRIKIGSRRVLVNTWTNGYSILPLFQCNTSNQHWITSLLWYSLQSRILKRNIVSCAWAQCAEI